jgi:diaminohydroxyphosphoribosylaminopyrimidine deaminase/5-amino-6-(5-phosphoribosylamino)uracil reductase
LVTLKAAATLDGFIAETAPRRKRAPVWITGEEARRAAHQLRAAHDAILVGGGTVRADDPHLTVRLPGRRAVRQPLRVVLAGRRRLPKRARVLDGAAPTLTIQDPGGRVSLKPALEVLAARGIQSLLVEGGAAIHGAFIAAGLVDRVALFLAPKLVGGGLAMASGANLPLARALTLGPISVRALGPDLLLTAEVTRR